MQIEKQYQIEAAAAGPKDNRPALTNVNIGMWKDKPVAVAANGFILVVVPATIDEGDVLGIVPASHIIDARKQAPKHHDVLTLALGADSTMTLDGTTRTRKVDSQFPDVDRIVPDLSTLTTRTAAIAFDVELLMRVGKALGDTRLGLLASEEHGPIIVKPLNHLSGTNWTSPPFGLIMPVHAAGERLVSPFAAAPSEQDEDTMDAVDTALALTALATAGSGD